MQKQILSRNTVEDSHMDSRRDFDIVKMRLLYPTGMFLIYWQVNGAPV